MFVPKMSLSNYLQVLKVCLTWPDTVELRCRVIALISKTATRNFKTESRVRRRANSANGMLLYNLSICHFNYFPFWLRGLDFRI